MSSFQIILEESDVDSLFSQFLGSIKFNLSKDYKTCFSKRITDGKSRIRQELDVELNKPINSLDRLQGIKPQDKLLIVKIRLADPFSNEGKQSGLRCIILIDTFHSYAVLLHIYSKKDKTKLTAKEINELAYIHRCYLKSLIDQ